jgi:hypothetical protein
MDPELLEFTTSDAISRRPGTTLRNNNTSFLLPSFLFLERRFFTSPVFRFAISATECASERVFRTANSASHRLQPGDHELHSLQVTLEAASNPRAQL